MMRPTTSGLWRPGMDNISRSFSYCNNKNCPSAFPQIASMGALLCIQWDGSSPSYARIITGLTAALAAELADQLNGSPHRLVGGAHRHLVQDLQQPNQGLRMFLCVGSQPRVAARTFQHFTASSRTQWRRCSPKMPLDRHAVADSLELAPWSRGQKKPTDCGSYFTFFTSPFFTPASGKIHIATTINAAVTMM
jgi:hypothetical protein